MKYLIKTMKALSDSNRIRILKMLEVRPLCVCEITDVLRLANSTVSKHLSILKEAEFIIDKKDGKWVEYQLNRETNITYINQLLPLLAQWLPDEKMIKEDRIKTHKSDRTQLCKTS